MLNYIRSELYRSIHNRNLKIVIGVFLGMICLLLGALVYFGKVEATFPYANTRFALGNIYNQMGYLLVIIVILAMVIDDNEGKNHTIKHSIAFGIERNTIYFGRFLVQALVCTTIYIVMTFVHTIFSFLLLEHSEVGELGHLLRIGIGGYTCLLAGLAIAYYFIMKYENQSIAISWALIVIVVIPTVFNLIGKKIELIRKIASVLPYNMVDYYGPLVQLKGNVVITVVGTTLIGLAWMFLFLVLGSNRFKNKEVK